MVYMKQITKQKLIIYTYIKILYIFNNANIILMILEKKCGNYPDDIIKRIIWIRHWIERNHSGIML